MTNREHDRGFLLCGVDRRDGELGEKAEGVGRVADLIRVTLPEPVLGVDRVRSCYDELGARQPAARVGRLAVQQDTRSRDGPPSSDHLCGTRRTASPDRTAPSPRRYPASHVMQRPKPERSARRSRRVEPGRVEPAGDLHVDRVQAWSEGEVRRARWSECSPCVEVDPVVDAHHVPGIGVVVEGVLARRDMGGQTERMTDLVRDTRQVDRERTVIVVPREPVDDARAGTSEVVDRGVEDVDERVESTEVEPGCLGPSQGPRSSSSAFGSAKREHLPPSRLRPRTCPPRAVPSSCRLSLCRPPW